jgi:hypothetical protein
MKNKNRWAVLVALLASLSLAGCTKAVDTPQAADAPKADDSGPAKVEHLKGAEPARVTLAESAAKRLGIQTAVIESASDGGKSMSAVPYAAVLYDTGGDTWMYINTSPLVYVRHHITVDHMNGDQAVLADGPAVGTKVVIVGASELYGSETEFEEE